MTKRLFHYIKGFEKEAIKAPLFILIEAVCELFLPLLMADIIDVGINGDGGRGEPGLRPQPARGDVRQDTGLLVCGH